MASQSWLDARRMKSRQIKVDQMKGVKSSDRLRSTEYYVNWEFSFDKAESEESVNCYGITFN